MDTPLSRRLAGRLGWSGLRTLNRAGMLSREGLSVEVELEGAAIRVPLWSGIGLDHGSVPDRHLLAVLRALLELRDGAFVDVGAHVGQTLVKLLVLGDPRPYLGFEPKPRAAAYVQALLAANGRPDDAVLAAAAADLAGVASLSVAGDRDDAAHLVARGAGEPRSERAVRPVPAVRGDEAVTAAGLGAVGLLKIDAEGSELEVVRGFAETIARDRPPILCEILPFARSDREARRRAGELQAVLEDHEYSIFLCDASGALHRVSGPEEGRSFEERDFVFVQAREAGLLAGSTAD